MSVATSPYSPSVVASALAVFGLSGDYTSASLGAAHRRVALRCHPDKGGRQELFDTVQECYRVLHDHARIVGMWDDARRLDDAYESAVAGRVDEAQPLQPLQQPLQQPLLQPLRLPQPYSQAQNPLRPATGAAFNVAEFNSRFDDSRTRVEERDAGYSDWLSKAAAEFDELKKPLIDPGKATARSFNMAFDKHTPVLDAQSGAIVVRPDYVSAGGLRGSLFDETEEVSDYTVEVGGGVSGADCRLAHGSQRLASTAWARNEVRVDRETLRRVAAERSGATAGLDGSCQIALGMGASSDGPSMSGAAPAVNRSILASKIDRAVSELLVGKQAQATPRARGGLV